jgi:hypothetical protein
MSERIFQGSGPFHLPAAQRAIASGTRNNGVSLTFYVIPPLHGPEPEAVRIQMTGSIAKELALHLIRAAETSDPTE